MTSKGFSFSVHPYGIDYSDLYSRAEAIHRAYSSGNLVYFVGSGVSKSYGSPMPNWDELMRAVLSAVEIKNQEHKNEILEHIRSQRYLLAAEAIKSFGNFDTEKKDLAVDEVVGRILKQRLQLSEKNSVLHLAILDFFVPIFTTNYDNIIEQIIGEYGIGDYRPNAITYEDQEEASRLLNPTRAHGNYVFKLHGSMERTQKLILDDRDYTDFYFHNRWPSSLQLLRHILSTKMVVFLGFSLSDPEIMLILREATRFSSSYQHIALMHHKALSSIERDVLRQNYRVDPILYEEHEHLPLYVMEMRNFYHRERVPLHLQDKRQVLMNVAEKIRKKHDLPSETSVILFGSYAKYGELAKMDADVDMLFLTHEEYNGKSHFSDAEADNLVGRKVDITVMARQDLESLIQVADAFATNMLVTGCPLADPNDLYGILCRGFKGRYDYQSVLDNALKRYETRWIRVCLLGSADLREYLQACHQWSIGLMQYFILKDLYPLDSLLEVSLLGNVRYVMREFAKRFQNFDEPYFLTLMQAAKGMISLDKYPRPKISDVIRKLYLALSSKYPARDLQFLKPGTFVTETNAPEIRFWYVQLELYLQALMKGETGVALGYGGFMDSEVSLLSILNEARGKHGMKLSIFDDLFFIRLYHKNSKLKNATDQKLLKLVDSTRKEWETMISKMVFDEKL